MFKIGDFVIMNDYDKPCPEMVAIVIGIELGNIHANYIDCKTYLNDIHSEENNVTKVEDFGIDTFISGKIMFFQPNGKESIATYSDGTVRNWQDDSAFEIKIDDEIYPLVELAISLRDEKQKVSDLSESVILSENSKREIANAARENEKRFERVSSVVIDMSIALLEVQNEGVGYLKHWENRNRDTLNTAKEIAKAVQGRKGVKNENVL